MYLKNLFNNLTIRETNIVTISVIFAFSLFFVILLVDEMYLDYEKTLTNNLSNIVVADTLKSQEIEEHLKALLIKTILSIVTISFIIFTISFGFYKIFNSILQSDTEKFLYFFEKAADAGEKLESKDIFFKDFRLMAEYANKMVATISKQKTTLKELNQNLEEMVQKKTADLLEINKNLEQEKTFSQELLASQKEFLRYAVHETNTPLSVILTSIELYEMKNKKDRQLSKIEAAVKNIFSIYDDLSYLVKKDQVEYPKVVINLEDYISSRIDFFMEVAEHSLVSFNYIVNAAELHILFNETKLQRIIDNTLTNAIKYTLTHEKIDVQLSQKGSEVVVSVGSKSKVIENIESVFDAYYREAHSVAGGFGLGLKLVRTICDEEGVGVALSSSDNYTSFTYRFKKIGV